MFNTGYKYNQFAPVMPMSVFRALGAICPSPQDYAKVLGNYHLLLAHDVLKSEQSAFEYGQSFDFLRNLYAGMPFEIIMDNSVVELGTAATLKNTIGAAQIVKATVAVIPDALEQAEGTIRQLEMSLHDLSKVSISPTNPMPKLMFVPQGKSFKEFVWCLEEASKYSMIDWIGIPRLAVKHLGTRLGLIQATRMIFPKADIHLLGFSDNIFDDLVCAASAGIAGIDSAVPIRAGLSLIPFKISQDDYGKRGDYWDAPFLEADRLQMAAQNMTKVRSSIRNLFEAAL